MIRPLERGDIDAVLDLWQALMANGQAADPRYRPHPDGRAPMRDYIRDTWLRTQPFVHAWVAEDQGLIGFFDILPMHPLPVLDRPPVARVGDLWVDPAHRRKGLGRALVERGIGEAKAAGYPWIEVGTLQADTDAVAFWAALGFEPWLVTRLRRER